MTCIKRLQHFFCIRIPITCINIKQNQAYLLLSHPCIVLQHHRMKWKQWLKPSVRLRSTWSTVGIFRPRLSSTILLLSRNWMSSSLYTCHDDQHVIINIEHRLKIILRFKWDIDSIYCYFQCTYTWGCLYNISRAKPNPSIFW